MRLWDSFSKNMAYLNRDMIIKQQIKKRNLTVYGSQALKFHLGFMARQPGDWDVLSSRPKSSAHRLQGNLDKASGSDVYYSKPSEYHKDTHKVYHHGLDQKQRTKDDIAIADFSKPERRMQTKTIRGFRVVSLREITKDKRRALSQREFSFRWAKDREDLKRIRMARMLRRN